MKTIAVSGKGGTGKTTISAMIVRWLSETGIRSILAVDADSNVNLNDLLGVEITDTVGAIREEMKTEARNLPAGMSKQEFLEYKISSSLIEGPKFDLIAMGRPEGPGCYCYANNLLRDILRTLSTRYTYVVIDNEAGMEHLSRRTTQEVDYLLIVSDPSVRSLKAAGRIHRLAGEMEIRAGHTGLILNRTQHQDLESLKETLDREAPVLLAALPEDRSLQAMDLAGDSIWSIPPESGAYTGLVSSLSQLLKRGHHDD